MIVFDTNTLSVAWITGATVGSRRTKKPIKYAKERLELFIDSIAAVDDTIIIPAPVLSEILVKIPDKTDELLKRIRSSPWFKIEGFDGAAAVELGLRTAKAIADGDKREGLRADWTKVKFDRQIVAIALVVNASEIISDDPDIAAIGERWNMPVRSVEDLPLPKRLILPPLLSHLEDEDEPEQHEETKPASAGLRAGRDGHTEDQAGTEAAKGSAETQRQSSEEEELAKLDISKELETEPEPPKAIAAIASATDTVPAQKSKTPVSVKPTGDAKDGS